MLNYMWYFIIVILKASMEIRQPFNILKQFLERLSIKMEQQVNKREQKKILLSPEKKKMRIAICEKEKKSAEKIKNLIYSYAEIHRLDIVADSYSNGNDLLCSKVLYNLIFIGYELNNKNGLEIAKDLRDSNSFSAIVFISENTDIIFETFKVSAFRFLVPPVKEDEIFTLLDDFFHKFGIDNPLWIKSGEETYCLDSNDIYFVEANNKHCVVHLMNEVIPCNRTMAKIFAILPKSHFVKINRAYIVNIRHIIKYNNDNVYLKNGETVHISRNYFKEFKENYCHCVNPKIP